MRDQRVVILRIAAAQDPGLFRQVELQPSRASELIATRTEQ